MIDMFDFNAASILFWVSVWIALTYKGGKKLVQKVKASQFEGYEDHDREEK